MKFIIEIDNNQSPEAIKSVLTDALADFLKARKCAVESETLDISNIKRYVVERYKDSPFSFQEKKLKECAGRVKTARKLRHAVFTMKII